MAITMTGTENQTEPLPQLDEISAWQVQTTEFSQKDLIIGS
jgi:hypothetical protein